MKHLYFPFLLLLLLSSSTFAQIGFKQGYFIDNSGNKIDCLIKDVEWKSNPTTFEYKLSDEAVVQIAKIDNVEMFQIENSGKYLRRTVDIDRWDVFSPITNQKYPVYNSEILFLKELINGAATLYTYTDGSFASYFYQVNNSKLTQLIRKEYIGEDKDGKELRFTNYMYKRQLNADLKCEDISENDASRLEYYEEPLVKFFQKYNRCKGEISDITETKNVKLHLSIRPGIVFNSLGVKYQSDERYNYDFGSKMQLRVGLEAELVLPFNKSKWALLLEPVYSSFKADGDGTIFTDDVNYQVIDFQIGLRHYMYINPDARVFVNAGAVFAMNLTNEDYFPERYPSSFAYKPSPQIVLGAGYKYNKLSAEIRYLGTQNLMANQTSWEAKFTSLSLVLGYEIL